MRPLFREFRQRNTLYAKVYNARAKLWSVLSRFVQLTNRLNSRALIGQKLWLMRVKIKKMT